VERDRNHHEPGRGSSQRYCAFASHWYTLRRDWDSLTNALTGIVWHDDRQIEEAAVRMAIDRERPRTEITVTKGKGGL
jgi:Holliday junction resolvase RusA-like endonuclease